MKTEQKNLLFTKLRAKAENEYSNDWEKRKHFFKGAEECLNIIEKTLNL